MRVVAAVLGAVFLLASWPVAAKDKVELACSSAGLMFAVPYVAKRLGFFEAQGLDVDVYDAGGGGNAVAAVAGGTAQIGLVGYKNMSLAALKGQPLKAVGTVLRGFPQDIVVRPDLLAQAKLTPDSSLVDKAALLGKRTIGVNEVGGSSGEFVHFVLKAAGLPDDAKLINITNPEGRLSSLKAKRIDAFVDGSPSSDLAVAGGYGATLISPSRDLKDLTNFEYLVLAVRPDYLAAHKDVVQRYLVATQQALDVIQREPDKAKAAVFAFLADQASAEVSYPKDIQDRAWTGILPNFPKTVLINGQALAAAHKFFGVSDTLTDSDLVDSSLAQSIASR